MMHAPIAVVFKFLDRVISNLPNGPQSNRTPEEIARQRMAAEAERIRLDKRNSEEVERAHIAAVFICLATLILALVYVVMAYFNGWDREYINFAIKFLFISIFCGVIKLFMK